MVYTSSSDEADSEAMFPAEHEPPGSATANQGSMLAEPFDNTPPHSQDPGEAMDTGNQSGEPGNVVVESQNGNWVPKSDFAKSAAGETHVPGSGWNNKKAMDDYQRASMQVEDKNFSLSGLYCRKNELCGLTACRGIWRPVR